MEVLIVGASTPHHTLIEEILQSHGYAVFREEEPDEAWRIYEEVQPHLVVMGVGARSRVLARRIRASEGGEMVILLAMVHLDAEDAVEEILGVEIDDCISVKTDPAYIKARLVLALRRSCRRRQRYQIEQALRESEHKFRALAENIPGVVYLCNHDDAYSMLYLNDAVEKLTGYSKEAFLTREIDFADLFHPDDRDSIYASVDQAIEERQPFQLQYRIRHRSGAWRWVAETGVGVFDQDEVLYLEGFLTDVTDRMKARQALRESEARTRAILDTTVDGIITIDERGLIETFNAAAEHIFGYQADEVIGQRVNMLMPAPYREEHDGYLQNYLETGRRKIIGIGREVSGLRKDGSIFPMDLAVSELVFEDRRVFTGIVRDVSDRRSLEQEILRISEQERRRIGQDLHDGLGQMLTGIGLITKNLARSLEQQDHPGADEVTEVTELIKEADQHARMLARGLMPVDLEAPGLAAALRRLTLNAGRLFGIQCAFEEVGEVLINDNSVATHLYRIAQEAVSNAVKHGRATHVKISLAAGRQIRLRIHDDGVGFPDIIDEERRGMGVRIMQYRARVIGATLDITDGHDGGTTITCTLRRSKEALRLAEDLAV